MSDAAKDYASAREEYEDKLAETPPTDEPEKSAYEAELVRLSDAVDAAEENLETETNRYLNCNVSLRAALTKYQTDIQKAQTAMSKAMDGLVDVGTGIASVSLEKQKDQKSKLDKQIEEINEELKKDDVSPDSWAELTNQRNSVTAERDKLQADIDSKRGSNDVKDAISDGADGYFSGVGDELKGYTCAGLSGYISALQSEWNLVKSDIPDNVTGDNYIDYLDGLDAATYHNTTPSGIIDAGKIGTYFLEMAAQATGIDGDFTLSGFISAAIELIKAVFDVDFVYDAQLSANLNASALLNSIPAGNTVYDVFQRLAAAISDLAVIVGIPIIGLFLKLKSFIDNIKGFFQAVIDWGRNIFEVLSQRDGELFFLSAYNTWNMPCRTDMKGSAFKMMGGKSLNDLALPTFELGGVPLIGEGASLINAIVAAISGGGADSQLMGAEMEYILVGANSEIGNQAFVFLQLYLFRLVVDAIPVILNCLIRPEVLALGAATFGIGPVVVAVLTALLEPLTDMLLLVNGKTASLIKIELNLSATGLPKFIKKITINETLKAKLKKVIGNSGVDLVTDPVPSLDGKYPWDLDYREHCFLQLWFTVTKERQLERLQNVIQMESDYYYSNIADPRYAAFDLKASNTELLTKADITIKQFMPTTFSKLSENLFSLSREQTRRY
jgi:hypothetical protein